MLSMWIVLVDRVSSPMSHVRAQPDAAAAGLVDRLDLVGRIQNLPTGRKIRAFDVLRELRVAQLVVLQQTDQRRAHFPEVVRRDVRRHPDGDAGGAVNQQVRQARRQHHRLGLRAVVVRTVGDGVLLDLGRAARR